MLFRTRRDSKIPTEPAKAVTPEAKVLFCSCGEEVTIHDLTKSVRCSVCNTLVNYGLDVDYANGPVVPIEEPKRENGPVCWNAPAI